MIVGIDFDNTLVNYDGVFFQRALELGLVHSHPVLNKRQVRDGIRLLSEGEVLWQKLQSYVYTQGMVQAHLINGVKDFFVACQKANIQTFIVSHKTRYASAISDQVNLRVIAMDWMKDNGFFDPSGLGLDQAQVYFESTRAEKIQRIKQLSCTHFIDDLQEVFMEDEFPSGIRKILYSPDGERPQKEDIHVVETWEGIHEYFFN